MREDARAKATRLLAEGRVVVIAASRGHITATVRGEGRIHRAGFDHLGWHCTCEVRTEHCSHVLALKRISAPDLGDPA